MDIFSTFRIALLALRTNALRSALTMLGIIIGVAAVIAMIAVGKGAQSRVEEQVRSLGANVMVVFPSSQNSGGVRSGSGGVQTLTEDDARAVALEVPEVMFAAPTHRASGQVVYGNQNWFAAVFGVNNDFFEVREWPLVAGRTFEQGEIASSGKVIILGQTVARQLFGEDTPFEDMIDRVVRLRKVPLTVIGVAERKGQSAVGQDQDDAVFVPLSTARTRLFGVVQGKLRRINSIWIKVSPGQDMKAAEDGTRTLLRQRHRLAAGQEDDFTLRNLTEIMQAQEAASRAMTALLAAIASVSLLVGGIGIMNIMLVSVTERTREIGLRMAVGARGGDILSQFLVEAVTLSCIGGAIGVALGVFAAEMVGKSASWRIEIQPPAILLAFGSAALIGIFFGFYPARKASQLEPIEALRYE
ncbi:MAG: ABC transporter permease [Burkholderiales bacterium]|jgi:putative ABC transport system permease protein|nr:ABC transporter permease [Burkholderiales bacterium]